MSIYKGEISQLLNIRLLKNWQAINQGKIKSVMIDRMDRKEREHIIPSGMKSK